jgi:hypothetical protein
MLWQICIGQNAFLALFFPLSSSPNIILKTDGAEVWIGPHHFCGAGARLHESLVSSRIAKLIVRGNQHGHEIASFFAVPSTR